MNAELLDQLTGSTEAHLQNCGDGVQLHKDVVAPWRALCSDAREDGIELAIASGFRSCERQRAIWQAKALGQRPLLDRDGQPLNIYELTPSQLLHAIMRWSAIPGASRHHWGTDIDIFDASAVDESYQLQLVPEEYAEGGPFARMNQWLDERIECGFAHGFYRPYCDDLGGVAPEPWHLSYRPVSEQYLLAFTPAVFRVWLSQQDWLLADIALEQSDCLYEKFIAV